MKIFQNMMTRYFNSRTDLDMVSGTAIMHAAPQSLDDFPDSPPVTSATLPPGESTGRHFLQRRVRNSKDLSRLPMESQNAIFFSGLQRK